jgi:hypothetical protein
VTSIKIATGAMFAPTESASPVAITKMTAALGTVVRKGCVIAELIAFPVNVKRNVPSISISARKTGSAVRECVCAVPGTKGLRCVR